MHNGSCVTRLVTRLVRAARLCALRWALGWLTLGTAGLVASAGSLVAGPAFSTACLARLVATGGRAAAARLRSCACREAAAYLDAFPAKPLLLSDADLRTGLRLHLGVLQLPAAAIGTRCTCGQRLSEHDGAHAMVCSKASGPVESRHHHVVDVWCQAGRRAALDTCREPRLRMLRARVHAQAVQLPESAKSRGDILIPHQAGLEIIDVSITDPTAQSYVCALRWALGWLTLGTAGLVASAGSLVAGPAFSWSELCLPP